MTTIQIIALILGCIFSAIGIFFIYKGIGSEESDIDIAVIGKIKTKSTGLILFITGAIFVFYALYHRSGKVDGSQNSINDSVQKADTKVTNQFEQEGDHNIQINNPTGTTQIDISTDTSHTH